MFCGSSLVLLCNVYDCDAMIDICVRLFYAWFAIWTILVSKIFNQDLIKYFAVLQLMRRLQRTPLQSTALVPFFSSRRARNTYGHGKSGSGVTSNIVSGHAKAL